MKKMRLRYRILAACAVLLVILLLQLFPSGKANGNTNRLFDLSSCHCTQDSCQRRITWALTAPRGPSHFGHYLTHVRGVIPPEAFHVGPKAAILQYRQQRLKEIAFIVLYRHNQIISFVQ